MEAVRPLVLKRDNYLCCRCGSQTCQPLDMHHRRGRGQGGPDTLENLVTLGRPCHDAVTDRIAADWRDWIVTRKTVLS